MISTFFSFNIYFNCNKKNVKFQLKIVFIVYLGYNKKHIKI